MSPPLSFPPSILFRELVISPKPIFEVKSVGEEAEPVSEPENFSMMNGITTPEILVAIDWSMPNLLAKDATKLLDKEDTIECDCKFPPLPLNRLITESNPPLVASFFKPSVTVSLATLKILPICSGFTPICSS